VNGPGPLHAELKARFGDGVGEGGADGAFEVIRVDGGSIRGVASFLKASGNFALMDLTAVDWLGCGGGEKPARLELVYYFFQLSGAGRAKRAGMRVRVKVPVPDDGTAVPSLAPVFGSADWLEREVWDMFGIRFAGHPNLKRILLYEEFSGHPLRKDYPLRGQQPRVRQGFPGVPPFGRRPDVLG
jgi:NADH-quinone oxidoreductase subunit C